MEDGYSAFASTPHAVAQGTVLANRSFSIDSLPAARQPNRLPGLTQKSSQASAMNELMVSANTPTSSDTHSQAQHAAHGRGMRSQAKNSSAPISAVTQKALASAVDDGETMSAMAWMSCRESIGRPGRHPPYVRPVLPRHHTPDMRRAKMPPFPIFPPPDSMSNIYDIAVAAIRDHWKTHDNRYPRKLVLSTAQHQALMGQRKLGQIGIGTANELPTDSFMGVPLERDDSTPPVVVAVDGQSTPLAVAG